jgi:hypothetical protein
MRIYSPDHAALDTGACSGIILILDRGSACVACMGERDRRGLRGRRGSGGRRRAHVAAASPVLRRCSSGAPVLEFLCYLDRFSKTRVHTPSCSANGCDRMKTDRIQTDTVSLNSRIGFGYGQYILC